MTFPCKNCKRTSYPKVCYPKRDYIRSQRKKPKKMCVYMIVTKDEFRLPLEIAESVEELAQLVGESVGSVARQISRVRSGKVKNSKYEIVFVDRKEWES